MRLEPAAILDRATAAGSNTEAVSAFLALPVLFRAKPLCAALLGKGKLAHPLGAIVTQHKRCALLAVRRGFIALRFIGLARKVA